jgi:hypothetical protein
LASVEEIAGSVELAAAGCKGLAGAHERVAVAFRIPRSSLAALAARLEQSATPLPTASDIFLVAPVVESATAVARPVRTPVAMLWRFTALRIDLPRPFVAFFVFFFMPH